MPWLDELPFVEQERPYGRILANIAFGSHQRFMTAT
jgi:hypothetical protein